MTHPPEGKEKDAHREMVRVEMKVRGEKKRGSELVLLFHLICWGQSLEEGGEMFQIYLENKLWLKDK